MKILIVDDEVNLALGMLKVLTMYNHEAWVSKNGNEAWDFLSTHPVDVIITDIIMPQMDGIELIMKIKETYPDIRMIAISGGGRITAEDHLYGAKRLGADAILKKPFSMNEILDILGKIMN